MRNKKQRKKSQWRKRHGREKERSVKTEDIRKRNNECDRKKISKGTIKVNNKYK